MARKNLIVIRLEAYLLDRNLSPEQFGAEVGLSGMTIRRALYGDGLSRDSKWLIARGLGEDPSTFWPPMPRKRQPGGSRARGTARVVA